MNALMPWVLLALASSWPGAAGARLQLLPDGEPQRLFAGAGRKITLEWHNDGDRTAVAEVRTRLFQTSSATAAPLAEIPWKKIEVLSGQTVLESASLNFPAVNAETCFLIQWLENSNHVLGQTEVLVYPTNLLQELKMLTDEKTFGVLDPNNQLMPLLKQNSVPFLDLSAMSLEDFRGRLAIIGPFSSRIQVREGLARAIARITSRGAAVVWIQPPPEPKDPLKPSFYIVPEGKGAAVVVQADLVARLAECPQSQLNLLSLCNLALAPRLFSLPDFAAQP